MTTRDELVAAIVGRYGRSSRAERGRILNEFVAVTGFHRNMPLVCLAADSGMDGLPRINTVPRCHFSHHSRASILGLRDNPQLLFNRPTSPTFAFRDDLDRAAASEAVSKLEREGLEIRAIQGI